VNIGDHATNVARAVRLLVARVYVLASASTRLYIPMCDSHLMLSRYLIVGSWKKRLFPSLKE
jgi:hypothetical protein